ncbi:MAG: hydrogenase iron-sulfur subunit [Deltaproteobacteria bacterium]|nr:hydrogenase iron-sulfur subunit [Deltaproteobacteria bacterium]
MPKHNPATGPNRATRTIAQAITWLDKGFSRVYGAGANPLYHTGPLAIWMLLVAVITGVYLVFFYELSHPFESVAWLQSQPVWGRWIRALHRYSSDGAVVLTTLHVIRMFVQGRRWGPRMMAWLSGGLLLAALLLVGWTGFVMVWDGQGQLIAVAGARLLDSLPLFTEPVGRGFVKPELIGPSFFFINLFLHLALPLAMTGLLWWHTIRLSRPGWFPPRLLMWWSLGALTLLSVAAPPGLAGKADLLGVPSPGEVDLFYNFWLLAGAVVSPGWQMALWVGLWLALMAVPWLSRPWPAARRPESWVDQRHCDGCLQCYLDCPYNAIRMVPPPSEGVGQSPGRQKDHDVAWVETRLCVSCGICSASCSPMVIGPPGRTGRDQWHQAAALAKKAASLDHRPAIAVILCANALSPGERAALTGPDRLGWQVDCSGEIHPQTVAYLLAHGLDGVLVAACPPAGCQNREGSRYLEERLSGRRDPGQKAKVDPLRVDLQWAESGDLPRLKAAMAGFETRLRELESPSKPKRGHP